ncbi:MAG: alpha/beta hydrolase [Gammaproteobacteria bacterium]|nr:alpha/beta hydrolase [Gammaproteobacteria bacterium]
MPEQADGLKQWLTPRWVLPEPHSTHEVPVDDDTVIVLRRHGNPDGARLILTHGNGLAIDLYYPFWSLLTDRFDVVVHDLRNHGWNRVSPLDRHNMPTLAGDQDCVLEAVASRYGDKPAVGVFHSVAALAALLSPTKGSGYAGLVLFDPPLCKAGRSYFDFDAAAMRNAAQARRRTEQFASLRDFVELLAIVPMYRQALPGVHRLLADSTLRRRTDGDGFELRCPCEYEAQIVEYASVFAVTINFDSFHCPIKVIGADPTLPYSYLPSMDLSNIMSVDYDFVPDATHLLQLEQPDECVASMLGFLDEISFA